MNSIESTPKRSGSHSDQSAEAKRARQRRYVSKYGKKNRRDRKLKDYGLTAEQFDARLEEQAGRCRICNVVISEAVQTGMRRGVGEVLVPTATTIAIDHCHETGKVRGLLCMLCNRGLGDFKDDPAALRRAADYLEERR